MMYLTNLEQAQKVNRLLDEAYEKRVNNLTQSIELSNKALKISLKLEETGLVARCKSRLSLFHMIRGEYEKSMEMGKEAIGLFQVLGDDQGLADSKY
ncbi:MAG: hypothetical protein RJQ14_09625, partial [Marinoscillum sp.]